MNNNGLYLDIKLPKAVKLLSFQKGSPPKYYVTEKRFLNSFFAIAPFPGKKKQQKKTRHPCS